MTKPRLLWVGDAGCDSGFSKITHGVLPVLDQIWEIHILGLNFLGDPHPLQKQFPVYPAYVGGDAFGVRRLKKLVEAIEPEVIVFLNDPWNIPDYVKELEDCDHYCKRVGSIAVDGKNCRGLSMNSLDLTVFWTRFGLNEAVNGDFVGKSAVIPLGVSLDTFQPMSRLEARRARLLEQVTEDKLPPGMLESWIVGNINRNQIRKRLDLTIEYFAEWITSYKIDNAYLYLHVAPTGDQGYDCAQLARYYGVDKKLILAKPGVFRGLLDKDLTITYNCFDVQVSTTQGEGWGLTTLEGMACGIPQIVPDWSALGEWAEPAIRIPCSNHSTTGDFVNAIGGVPDREPFIRALHQLYSDRDFYRDVREAGLIFSKRPEFDWDHIGFQYAQAIGLATGKRIRIAEEAAASA